MERFEFVKIKGIDRYKAFLRAGSAGKPDTVRIGEIKKRSVGLPWSDNPPRTEWDARAPDGELIAYGCKTRKEAAGFLEARYAREQSEAR